MVISQYFSKVVLIEVLVLVVNDTKKECSKSIVLVFHLLFIVCHILAVKAFFMCSINNESKKEGRKSYSMAVQKKK